MDITNLPYSELRPLSETAFGAVNDQFNLTGMSPFLSNTLQNRAQAAVPQFRLGAALGQYGPFGVNNNQVQLGGKGIQGLMKDSALKNVTGAPTSNAYNNFLNAARNGLGGNDGQSASIMSALGITGSDSAQDAYRPVYNQFVAPRLNLLPTGIRDIFQSGAQKEMQQILGGKSSAEISPQDFLKKLSDRGMFQ